MTFLSTYLPPPDTVFQAKKRKLGLLEDDDVSKLEDLTSTKEKEVGGGRVNDGSASFVKQRGKRKLFLYVHHW